MKTIFLLLQALLNTAVSLLEAGVALHAIGVQSHINDYPDIVAIQVSVKV